MTSGVPTGVSPAELASQLRPALLRLTRLIRNQRVDMSVTLTQLSALATLRKHGPMSPGELAAVERVQPPSMTKVLALLEERGLVTRQAHPTDRRQAIIVLADSGIALLNSERRSRDAWLSRHLAELTPEERALLLSGLFDAAFYRETYADLLAMLRVVDLAGTLMWIACQVVKLFRPAMQEPFDAIGRVALGTGIRHGIGFDQHQTLLTNLPWVDCIIDSPVSLSGKLARNVSRCLESCSARFLRANSACGPPVWPVTALSIRPSWWRRHAVEWMERYDSRSWSSADARRGAGHL